MRKRKHVMFLNSSQFLFMSLCSSASMLNFEFLCLPWTNSWDMLLFTSGILLVIHKYQRDIQRRVNIIIPIFANGAGLLTHAVLQARSIDLSISSFFKFFYLQSFSFLHKQPFQIFPGIKEIKKEEEKIQFHNQWKIRLFSNVLDLHKTPRAAVLNQKTDSSGMGCGGGGGGGQWPSQGIQETWHPWSALSLTY